SCGCESRTAPEIFGRCAGCAIRCSARCVSATESDHVPRPRFFGPCPRSHAPCDPTPRGRTLPYGCGCARSKCPPTASSPRHCFLEFQVESVRIVGERNSVKRASGENLVICPAWRGILALFPRSHTVTSPPDPTSRKNPMTLQR